VWTWTALDSESKLMVTWLVGERSIEAARDFMADLAIEAAFGSDVDYAQLLKQYGVMPSEDGSPTARRYSPLAMGTTHSSIRPLLCHETHPPRFLIRKRARLSGRECRCRFSTEVSGSATTGR